MNLFDFAMAEAARQGVDADLVSRVIRQESGGNPRAVSPAGARGIMQLMPGTAKDMGVNIDDAYDNVRGGIKYLGQQLKTFGAQDLALAAYNAGPGNVRKYGGIPPFKETQNYVRSILGTGTSMRANDDADIFGSPSPKPAGQQPRDDSDIFGSTSKPISFGATQPRTTAAPEAQTPTQPDSLGRQLGLTARYGLEGVANAAQLVTEPIRYVTDRLTGQTGKTKPLGALATQAADAMGLPTPQTGGERVIGEASRLVAGAGGMAGAAGAAGRATTGATQAVMQGLAANPAQQISSAAGAGLAGGHAKETGASPIYQMASSLAGGVAGGLLPGAVTGTANAATNAFNRTVNKLTPQQIDVQIAQILKSQGVDYSQLSSAAKNSLRGQMADALNARQTVDPAAVRRLADFTAVGATPTRGMVSQDPVQITREMNLAKIAAASSDDSLSGLPLIQNRNNTALIGRLNDAGAARGDANAAGQALSGAVIGRRDALRAAEKQAWDAARGMPGYTQPIEKNVLSQINGALDEEGLMPFMNKTISDYMGAFQTGERPFTPQDYRNLQSMLSREMAKGGNEAAAAGVAARVLNATDLRPINPAGHITTPVPPGMAARLDDYLAQPGQALDAVNQARGATRAAYAFESSSPLVRTALADAATADPQRMAARYIIGGTVDEAREVARHVGQAPVVKDAILAHLKEKALNGASDEVGKFSQSAYNKALSSVGQRKLELFFNAEEIAQLNAVGRAASYMQVQPVGSAVNNSNSGALLLGKGLDMLNMMPLGKALVTEPMRQLRVNIGTKQAQNIVPGLLANAPKQRVAPGMLAPALAYGGLLAAPD